MDDDDGGDDVYRCITGLVSDHLDRGAKVSPAHHVVLDHHDALDAHLRDQGLARFQVCVFPSSHPARARAPRHLLHSNALRRTLPCASHRHLVHKNALRRMPIPPWLPGPDTPFFFFSISLHRRAPCCAHARAHEPPRRRAFVFPPPPSPPPSPPSSSPQALLKDRRLKRDASNGVEWFAEHARAQLATESAVDSKPRWLAWLGLASDMRSSTAKKGPPRADGETFMAFWCQDARSARRAVQSLQLDEIRSVAHILLNKCLVPHLEWLSYQRDDVELTVRELPPTDVWPLLPRALQV